jgi:AcrR family transcriptional regulator
MIAQRNDSESQRTRAQRRATRTRSQLLEAALDMFAAKGVEATTIEDVTERADVGKGTFYRHFSSKHAVVAALSSEILDRLVARIKSVKKTPQTLEDVLESLLDAHLSFFEERGSEFLFLFQGRLMLKLQKQSAEVAEPYTQYIAEIQNQIAGHLASADVDQAKARRLAGALIGFVSVYLSLGMVGMSKEKIEAGIDPLRRAFVEGSSGFLKKPSVATVSAAKGEKSA